MFGPLGVWYKLPSKCKIVCIKWMHTGQWRLWVIRFWHRLLYFRGKSARCQLSRRAGGTPCCAVSHRCRELNCDSAAFYSVFGSLHWLRNLGYFSIWQDKQTCNLTFRRVRVAIVAVEKNKYYLLLSMCVSVASVTQHAMRMRRIIVSSASCLAVPCFFPHYLINSTIFGKQSYRT